MEDGSAPDVGGGMFSSVRRAPTVPMSSRPGKDRPDEGAVPVAERLRLLPVAASQVPGPVRGPDKAGRRRVLRAMAPDGVLAGILSEAVLGPNGLTLG